MKVVITGAGRGLGIELVRKHLDRGDEVLAMTHSLTRELEELSCDALVIKVCELTDYASILELARAVEGEIDILYNNAGLYYEDQSCGLDEIDMAKCLKMYEVNALAPLNVMRAFANKMRRGSVNLIVSSEAGSIGATGRESEFGYCMSKAAVNMAARIFSNGISEKGVKTVCYHPGWMRTQMGGERAAASEYSIAAEESAVCLLGIVEKALKEAADPEKCAEKKVDFVDYQGNSWVW